MSLAKEIDSQTQAHYIRVAEVIRQYGTVNKQYPRDKDLDFATIRSHYDVGGLGTVLKNMKAKKMVDYRDPFIKDETMVTLVEDYYQEFNPLNITYAEIIHKIKGDESSHVRHVAAEEGSS